MHHHPNPIHILGGEGRGTSACPRPLRLRLFPFPPCRARSPRATRACSGPCSSHPRPRPAPPATATFPATARAWDAHAACAATLAATHIDQHPSVRPSVRPGMNVHPERPACHCWAGRTNDSSPRPGARGSCLSRWVGPPPTVATAARGANNTNKCVGGRAGGQRLGAPGRGGELQGPLHKTRGAAQGRAAGQGGSASKIPELPGRL